MSGFHVLPGPPGTCPECSVAHADDEPHDKQSLAYQMRFHGKNGRWPTWKDALAHCPDEVKAAAETVLRELNAWDGDKSDVPDVMPSDDGTIGQVVMTKVCPPHDGETLYWGEQSNERMKCKRCGHEWWD